MGGEFSLYRGVAMTTVAISASFLSGAAVAAVTAGGDTESSVEVGLSTVDLARLALAGDVNDSGAGVFAASSGSDGACGSTAGGFFDNDRVTGLGFGTTGFALTTGFLGVGFLTAVFWGLGGSVGGGFTKGLIAGGQYGARSIRRMVITWAWGAIVF